MTTISVRQLWGGRAATTLRNSLLALMFAFGCGIISARMLGPADRGVLSLTLALTATCAVVSALGSNVALRVHLRAEGPPLLRGYLRLSSGLLLLQTGLVVTSTWVLLTLLHVRFTGPILACAIALGVALFGAQQTLDALNALGATGTSALVNAGGSAATLVVLGLAWREDLGLLTALGAYAAGGGVAIGVGLVLIRRSVPRGGAAPRRGDGKFLVRNGFRVLGHNLGPALAFKLDQYAVGALSGPYAAGLYAVAAAHVAPAQVASNALGQAAMAQTSASGLTGVRRLVGAAVALAGSVAVLVWVLSPWFIPLLFGPEFRSSVPVLRVLMVGQVVLAPYLVISRALAGLGAVRAASTCGVVLFVSLAVTLLAVVPHFGAVGAAWSTVIAFGVTSLVATVLLLRRARRTTPVIPELVPVPATHHDA